MKKKLLGLIATLAMCSACAMAQQGQASNSDPHWWTGPHYFYSLVSVQPNQLQIGGVAFTGTVSQLNNLCAGVFTNGMSNVGPQIGGNIPVASLTNALYGANPIVSVSFSGVITNGIGLATTNRIYVYQGIVTNVSYP